MALSKRREYEQMANWAELHQDILILIAKRVRFLEDFSVFGRVCRSWRSVAVKKNFKGSQQFPWLMLAEENNSNYRGFVSATDGNLIGKLMLPEAKDKQCFESLGWLITVSETGDMNLLNPVSRVQIPLPHISTSKNHPEGENLMTYFGLIEKAVLSSRPCVSSKNTNYVLMVIENCGYLVFWKPGDKVWSTAGNPLGLYKDITYYNGQFYAINCVGSIFVCDVGGHDPTVVEHFHEGIPSEIVEFKRPYIVESNGELLVVVRKGYDLDYLGDYALFVGESASISVKASKFQGIRPNCIYFTDDFRSGYIYFKRGGGEDMGIYNMEDRSVAPYYKVNSFSLICPPLWVRPYF